jgi:4-alpha-glucanotransferase
MSDDHLRQLAEKAGVSPYWRDQSGGDRAVSIDSLREILAALGLPAGNDADISQSLAALDAGGPKKCPLVTARVGEAVRLSCANPGAKIAVTTEGGAQKDLAPLEILSGAVLLPGFDTPGYHVAHLPDGDVTIAIAPKRCVTFADLKGGAGFGMAAQIYSLRTPDDGGIGNFSGVAALGRAAAGLGADLLAISPAHALFGADPNRFSPYSPSTRLFFNPLHADPAGALPPELVGQAIEASGQAAEMARLTDLKLIDWPAATQARLAALRKLFDLMRASDHTGEFEIFRGNAAPLLRDHAIFEVLHQKIWREQKIWRWRDWPSSLRDPRGAEVASLGEKHRDQLDFQIFLQWLTEKSFSAAQKTCRDAGMKVGLVADLAIGTDSDGSHGWSRPAELLTSLSIGAPPDYYAAEGQNWALAALSPRNLVEGGFSSFIETLRASLRHAGGLRIDHVMGLGRLWLIPEGRGALEGAYVGFPRDDLYCLMALESWRHKAIVIGEDLGTTPWGFRDFLANEGVYGMRVLRFERDDQGYVPPRDWSRDAAALTTTHDMIATAGWWKGVDLFDSPADECAAREKDRDQLWRSFCNAGVAQGDSPADWDCWPAVDAAIKYVAATPCALKIVAIEDALASEAQPNVPGTTMVKPNWRHRLDGEAAAWLDDARVRRRLEPLGKGLV